MAVGVRKAISKRPEPLPKHQTASKAIKRSRGRQRLFTGVVACAVTMFLLVHLTLVRRISNTSMTACSHSTAETVELDSMTLLQQLNLQAAWLQADVHSKVNTKIVMKHHITTNSIGAHQLQSSHVMREPLMLFIGVLSDDVSNQHLMRRSWFGEARSVHGCQAKFVMEEGAAMAQQRDQQSEDTLYVHSKTPVRKILFLLQYALVHFDVQFIMKVSGHTYVNVPNLMRALQDSCTSAQCAHEHTYLGHEVKNCSVPLAQDSNKPEASMQYFKTTHLKTFLPYMSGAGYVVSSDLAHVLLDTEHRTSSNDFLTDFDDADMTIGFWLLSLDVQRIDHPGIVVCPQGTCFQPQSDVIAQPAITHEAQPVLRPALTQPMATWNPNAVAKPITDLCRGDWLLMHPVSKEDELDYIQQRLQQCKTVDRIHSLATRHGARHQTTCHAHVPHGKVHRISHNHQQQQYLLGSPSASPWSTTGSMLLALQPSIKNDKLSLGLLKPTNMSSDNTWFWEHLDITSAWNTHQGPQLQWLGASDRYIAFNDGSCQGVTLVSDAYCTVIFDTQLLARLRVLPLPISALSKDGHLGLHVSLERQNHAMPGLGYTVTEDRLGTLAAPASDKDGLWLMDMLSGQVKLLTSLQQLARLQSGNIAITEVLQSGSPSHACYHWFSQPQFNEEATRIAVLHHITNCSSTQHPTDTAAADAHATVMTTSHATDAVELVTVNTDSTQLWVVPLDDVRRFDYGGRGKLLISTSQGLFEADVMKQSVQQLQPPITVAWSSLSYCSYYPHSERHILAVTSSWPRKEAVIWDRWTGDLDTVGLYTVRKEGALFSHPGLHPMWSPDGCSLAFDSTHTGQGWQVFIAGISGLCVDPVVGCPPGLPSQAGPPSHPKRHILIDLGSGTGGEIGKHLAANPSLGSSLQVHAFEPNPAHLQHLKAALARHKLANQVTVHEAAAWTADEQVSLHAAPRKAGVSQHAEQPSHDLMSHMMSSLIYSLAGKGLLLNSRMSIFGQEDEEEPVTVQAVAFSKWLLQTAHTQDHVVLKMDIAGAEFDVLHEMIVDGSIMLVDVMDVTWHEDLRLEYREWPLMMERLMQQLNIQSSFSHADGHSV